MVEAVSKLNEFIRLYNNERFLVVLFLLSLLFLWKTEKDKSVRMILVYLVTALTLVFICPLYAWIGLKMDEEVYYRVFWSLPVGVLFCYCCVKMVIRFKPVFSKVLISIMAVIVIVLNGKLVYTNTLHFKATNAYHIPQLVIDVADGLKIEGYKLNTVMPAELLPFIKQYSCDALTPYGRNILETRWGFESELYDAMETDIYDVELITSLANELNIPCVVLSSAKEQKGSMEENNFVLKCFAGGYFIYINKNYYDIFKEMQLLE